MQLFHAFTYDKMYQIKKYGLIPSRIDNLIYACDNSEDALEWVLDRETIRGKKISKLGMVIFKSEAQIGTDHNQNSYQGVNVYTVQGRVHPSKLTFVQVDITEDYFWQKNESNDIQPEDPSNELLFEIFYKSLQNKITVDTKTGKQTVGPFYELTQKQYRQLFDSLGSKSDHVLMN